MAYNIGVNVIEVDGSAPPTIVGAAVSVAGFNILTRRGVPNHPIRVTNFTQYVEQFGGFFPEGYGPYLVKGFFDNGGQRAYINRIVPASADPAGITLQDSAPANTLSLRGGYRGSEDPGTWGNALYVKVTHSSSASSRLLETAPATIQSGNLVPPIDMSPADPLLLRVDGEETDTTINFVNSDFPPDPNAATLQQIVNAINLKTKKVVAEVVDDGGNTRIRLTSTGMVAGLRKSLTSIQVMANHAALGFTTMAAPQGGTLATVTGTSARLGNIESFKVGDALNITAGANTHHAKITTINANTKAVTWDTAITDADLPAYNSATTLFSTVEFDLTIAYGGTEEENVVETWTALSMESDLANYVERRLNDTLSGSRYVTAEDEGSASAVGLDLPTVTAGENGFAAFNPGANGVPTPGDFIGDAAAHTGFYAFDALDIQLLTCERDDPLIVTTALGYCATRGDCTYVGFVPQGYVGNGQQAINYGQQFQGKKVYGALYGPWLKVFDPVGVGTTPMRWIPPAGHVMGVYARTETIRGIWKAPAGDEANLTGALDIEYRLSETEHTDLVKLGSINGIRFVPGAGIVVDASRTLSTDTRWLYVNVRLLFNYVKSSLKQGLRWTRQEPNRDTLWDMVKYNTVTPFLMGLYRQGAFGTGAPEDVFTVICDATNNPPEEVDKGNFKVEVYFYPSKPAETIIIIVGQQPSGGSASEA